jgi:chromosomal replication initiation ATPase DnaA
MPAGILEPGDQLKQIAEAARAAADGHGCVLLVSGEAGIGKSTLVAAARNQLPAGGPCWLDTVTISPRLAHSVRSAT